MNFKIILQNFVWKHTFSHTEDKYPNLGLISGVKLTINFVWKYTFSHTEDKYQNLGLNLRRKIDKYRQAL